jgi:ribokinase
MRLAVVGHVEWVESLRVDRLPAPGEIVHGDDLREEAAGGGGVAAVRLAELVGGSDLFTALGEDEVGRRAHEQLSALGVRVHAASVEEPQRRGFVLVDRAGERTIVIAGNRLVPRGADPLPWPELSHFDGVYFTGGDVEALRFARTARVLVATARVLDTLRAGAVHLDALVGSAGDPAEAYRPGDLDPPPRLWVATMGAEGGVAVPGGRFDAPPLPGPVVDTYGAGDSFAAGLTYALARGDGREGAVAFAAGCAAAALTTRGAFGAPSA